MPTENEKKFVLTKMTAEEMQVFLGGHTAAISQGYVARDGETIVRLRAIHDKFEDNHRCILTVKCKSGGRVIEIEHDIDQRDFDDMWEMSRIRLRKIRSYVEDWEVDFFIDFDDKIYFIMAEIEMPEGQTHPTTIPSLIKQHLLYEVPYHDSRFSSRKLGNIKKAAKLWRKLHQSKDKNDQRKT